MGKQIKSLACISSIVIPCKEQLKSSSALLKTIHHETPTNAPPPPAERWWKSTLTRKDHQQSRKPHWGTFQRTWKKKEYASGTFFLQSEMISWMRTCEESEGSRALMFKSFLYDKHAALLEPVKRKAEMWGGEGAVLRCFGGPPETRGCNEWLPPWKLTFLKGLVTPIPCWCVA